MALLKCKMCGGDIVLNEEKTFYTCESCGTSMTLPKVSDEQRAALFNRGNHFRRIGEFDKALAIYENIVREDDADAEAHWCCVLCRFGIEYVEDPTTYEFLPTCHRVSFDSVLEDVDYLAALEHSDGITKRQYQKDAAKIAEVQRGILATSRNEEPFDVFICYKESDDSTKERTRDSVDAQEIYYQLTQEGYRVFFSRITLEDKVGTEYEPYIFAALNSAKVMIVIGSKPEYFNAVWVKNEWSRFISLMKKDRNKLLIPCYKEMDPYDLPEQLSALQSYDMTKIGFVQDLIRGINKIVKTDETKQVVVGAGSTNIQPLLERAFLFLEDGKWQDADIYCEKVLDIDPRNAEAYLGKLMAELQVNNRSQLADCQEPFDARENYSKVIRFGDDKLETEMRGYIVNINERVEERRKLAEQREEKLRRKAGAVERALKNGVKFQSCQNLEERLVEAKTRVEYLERVLNDYDAMPSQLQTLQSEFNVLATQEKQLADKRKLLGVFAGKENSQELSAVSAKMSDLTQRINQIQQTFVNYPTVADVERDLNMTRNTAIEIEKRIEDDDREYSFEEALNIYLNQKDIATFVNGRYPAATLIPELYGGTNTILFGKYIQSKSGSPEPIEWQVLTRESGRVLVISKYALDCKFYNNEYVGITWENCSLRKWLNGIFLLTAFNSEEQRLIQNSTVFLLSVNEARNYFGSNEMRKCAPTDYAISQGVFTNSEHSTGGRTSCWYWLRTSGFSSNSARGVNRDGSIDSGYRVDGGNAAVRPALWINLE